MTSSTVALSQPPANSSTGSVAPAWHTVVLLVVLAFFAVLSALHNGLLGQGRIQGYCVIIVFEWAVSAFILYGARSRGLTLGDIVGGRWSGPADFFRDFGIGLAYVVVCGVGVFNGLGYLLKAKPTPGLLNMLPHNRTEIAVYLVLSLTAGYCEELIFRGYFRRQFSALTHSTAGGIVLQGIAFGAGHAYQGWRLLVVISAYGMMFGLLAHWRRSLRPGMLAHALQDGVGGILASLVR